MNVSYAISDKTPPRKLIGSPLAARGPTAGLPKRIQTDPHLNMTPQEITTIINAERFSVENHLPLTAHLTVVWRSPAFDGENPKCWGYEHRRLTRAMRNFLSKHHVTMAFVFVRERVTGRGGHTHFLIHIPQNKWNEIRAALEAYLIKRCK